MTKARRDIWDYRSLVMRGQCALCTSLNRFEVARRQDDLVILECADCGLAYVDPLPSSEQISSYYDSGYFRGQKDFFADNDYCETRDAGIVNQTVTGYHEVVSNFDIGGKSILDIGCASGALLKLLSSHNPAKLTGIDIAEYPVVYGKDRYGLDLQCTSLEVAAFPTGSFDLILIIDVIEHIELFLSFLQEVKRVLRSSGSIFLITPNYYGFSWAKSRWSCLYKDFEHLQYLSPFSLARLAERIGLKVVRWWTRGLPVLLSPYPRLYKMGFHRVLQPRISIVNLAERLKYSLLHSIRANSGHDLCAILKKEV